MAAGKMSGKPDRKVSVKADRTTTRTAAAATEKSSKVYPLYLIPQALAEEIHTKGDSIETIYVRRTAGHSYKIETESQIKTGEKTEDKAGVKGEGSDE